MTITLSVMLALVLLIQLFAWPFMVQRLSFQKLSPLRISKAVPGQLTGDTSDLPIGTVRQYAAGICRAWGWQLTGHEKALYRIAVKYLNQTPAAAGQVNSGQTGGIAAFLQANAALLADSSGVEQTVTREEIASDLSSLAVVLQQMGYVKLALTLSAAAVENNPVDPLLINNLAAALRTQGLNEDAYRLLSYANQLCPNSPVILTNIGNVCLDLGDLERASEWYDMALAIDDQFGLAHEGMMLYYMSQERYEVAMRHMIKASETVFTSAIAQTYDRISNLDNYDEIRDAVLDGFNFSELAETYQRTRGAATEGIDTPAKQIKIPQFPVYTGVESFMGGITGMNDYAMSIFTPALSSLEEVGKLAKQAEDLINSFDSGGLFGLLGEAQNQGLISFGSAGTTVNMSDGQLQMPVDYSREQFALSLLGDYVAMKTKKPLEQMDEQFAKSSDPLLQASERSSRELEGRGESEMAWLQAMANNWGNSFSLTDSTVTANKANINQHIDQFYQAILPAYNEIKPVLEEYWLYTGGIMKYVANDLAFKSMDIQRKMVLYGNLSLFAVYAEYEAINVPLVYAMYAVNGAPPEGEEPAEEVEKLEEPEPEEAEGSEVVNIDLGIVELEWSDGELEAELTALAAGSIKLDTNKGTITLAGGLGVSTGDFIPVAGGKATATYYVVIGRNGVADHGLATKTEYSVGALVQYKRKETTTQSMVTSAVNTTVEQVIAGGRVLTVGKKKTSTE